MAFSEIAVNMKDEQEKLYLSKEFALARRPVFVKVNLDAILNNLKILKGILAEHTGLHEFMIFPLFLTFNT